MPGLAVEPGHGVTSARLMLCAPGGLPVAQINGRGRSTFEGGENGRAVPGRLDRQRARPHEIDLTRSARLVPR